MLFTNRNAIPMKEITLAIELVNFMLELLDMNPKPSLSKEYRSLFVQILLIKSSSFSIICQRSNVFDLKSKESFFINTYSPSFNSRYENIKLNSAS